MWAALIHTVGIQAEIVCLDPEPQLVRNFGLFLFDFGIAEFDDTVALQADQVVMMVATVEFKHRFAGFEVLFL